MKYLKTTFWVLLAMSSIEMIVNQLCIIVCNNYLNFTCLVLFIVSSCFLLCAYKYIKFKIWIAQKYSAMYDCFIKNVTEYCKTLYDRFNQKQQTKKYDLDLLTPTINERNKYVGILKSAIDNKSVKNLAITGPYGSGKSTVIKTFRYLYPKYHCLNLSLASFADSSTTNNEDACIEYSLVQQIYYHVKAKEIPDSRYGRIKSFSSFKKICWAIAISIFLVAIIHLTAPEFFSKIYGNLEEDSIKRISLLVIFPLCLIFIYQAVGIFHRLNTAHLKVMDYEVSLEKDSNISVFNKYIDELIYLFTVTKYTIVFLEDLDRFANTTIFTKLRELNTLLNQSQDINRRIIFVYALKDEIFISSKERTKFFDYIISLTPYVNTYSAASHFVEKLKEYVGSDNDPHALHKHTLADIATFATDLRTIKAITSDFKVTKDLLDTSLNLDNLLAMIVYKNIFSKQYADIHEGTGQIVNIFNAKSSIISKAKENIEQKIKEIENKIQNIELEHLQSINELKSIVVAAYLKLLPKNCNICNASGNTCDVEFLYNDSQIDAILSGNMVYRDAYIRLHKISKEEIFSNLSSHFDYKARKENIDARKENKTSQLSSTKNMLLSELSVKNKESMKILYSQDPHILDEFLTDIDSEMLKLFIGRGYIDEKYYFYVSIFKEGLLSINDHDYLLAIKNFSNRDDDDFMTPLEEPKNLLSYIIDEDFKSYKILNFDLVKAIMQENKKNKELLIGKITEGNFIALDFFVRYPYPDDGFATEVCSRYPNIWTDFMLEIGFSNESRQECCTRILKYATIDAIKNINQDLQFREYIENLYFCDVTNEVALEKMKKIIDIIEPMFSDLSSCQSNKTLLNYIYQTSHYKLNERNIIYLVSKYGPIRISNQSGHLYTDIQNSHADKLIKNVDNNIEYVVKNILLSNNNNKESETSLKSLLNNEKLDDDLKKHLITYNNTKIDNLEQIGNKSVKEFLYECNKVVASLKNVFYYMELKNISTIDDILKNFINSNMEPIIDSINKIEWIDGNKRTKLNSLLLQSGIDEHFGFAIFQNVNTKEAWATSINELCDTYVKYIISERLIDYNTELFKQLLQDHKSIEEVILNHYKTDILSTLNDLNFQAIDLIHYAKLECFAKDINLLYNEITEDKLDDDETANNYLDFVASGNYSFKAAVYYKALHLSKDNNKKMASVITYIKGGYLHPSEYTSFFENMGDPFNALAVTETDFIIEKNSIAKDFCTLLNRKNILGKVNINYNHIGAYVKKRKA